MIVCDRCNRFRRSEEKCIGVILLAPTPCATCGTTLEHTQGIRAEESDRLPILAHLAAPTLVGALLEAEHASLETDEGSVRGCGVCQASLWASAPEHTNDFGELVCWRLVDNHEPGCVLDRALTLAGYPDQASRERARRASCKEQGTT